MSSKEEKIKQQIIEERQKQAALGREMEALRLDEERRKAAALLDDETPKNKPADEVSPVSFQSGGVESDDWKKITEDFKKQYPDTLIKNNCLMFPSQDEALAFFANQASAEPPRKFLARELGPDGNPTGFHAFSCGDGTLYKGTLEEIQEQLKAAQLEHSDDPNIKEGLLTIAKYLNPAQGYRDSLQQAKAPEITSNEPQAGQGLPNPLSTVPKTTP
ncbi:MAG: hypothetical protein M1486_02515 [Gammaproteobacteria bacterium]|nr:hypothetical protein [Gammaproteobacteria bacterium]